MVFGDRGRGQPRLLAGLCNVLPEEHRNILGAFCQRRDTQGADLQTIVQIRRQRPVVVCIVQRNVRPADQRRTALFDQIDQRDLRIRGQCADFIQKNGAVPCVRP